VRREARRARIVFTLWRAEVKRVVAIERGAGSLSKQREPAGVAVETGQEHVILGIKDRGRIYK
jgi:hypothetical protein